MRSLLRPSPDPAFRPRSLASLRRRQAAGSEVVAALAPPALLSLLVAANVTSLACRSPSPSRVLFPPSLEDAEPDWLLGSAELSAAELAGTRLAKHRGAQALLYVSEVAVHPRLRRRGVGRRLLASLEQLARARGAETLLLHARSDDGAARALYEGAGYRECGRHPYYEEVSGRLGLLEGHVLLRRDVGKVACEVGGEELGFR
ncbi:hypothetical protein TeGR_g3093 [Tetraparma gracilis]|uniref:N-acetyltransferase domain-containing protein n=1 Tax=Tetraparma gracilis TaxID=2962635 RepID=A0ABQ6MTS3_9STRA|nr:hypothetical protein TeGR_g3093 [Tetraparma gracilis]